MWTAHLLFDHLFFHSTMLTFYNNVRWHFLHIRLMLQIMPPPLSFFLFSSSRLSPTATARLHDEWWVDSLFLLLWLPRRNFCSLFLLLWLSFRNFRWIFREERLAKKILENQNLQLRHLNPQSSSLFYHWKFFASTWDWTRVCSLIMSLMHLLLISIDADMKIRDW